MKKLLMLLLAVCMLLPAIPVAAATPAFSGAYSGVSSTYKNGYVGEFTPKSVLAKSGSGGTESLPGVDYKASSSAPWDASGGFVMVYGDWANLKINVPYTGVYVMQLRTTWVRGGGTTTFRVTTDAGYYTEHTIGTGGWSSTYSQDQLIYLMKGENILTVELLGDSDIYNALLAWLDLGRLDKSGATKSLDFMPLVKQVKQYPENITTKSIDKPGTENTVWGNVVDYSDAQVSRDNYLWLEPNGWAKFDVTVKQTGFYYVQAKTMSGQTVLRTFAGGYKADLPVDTTEQFYRFDSNGEYLFVFLEQGTTSIYLQNVGKAGCEILTYEIKASSITYDEGIIPTMEDCAVPTEREATVISNLNLNADTASATVDFLKLENCVDTLWLILADFDSSNHVSALNLTTIDTTSQEVGTKRSYPVSLPGSFTNLKTFIVDTNLTPYTGVALEAENPELAVYSDIYVSPTGNDNNDGSKNAPVKTLARANELVAELTPDMTDDIVVHFAGGNYPVSSMMTIDNSVSGQNGYKVIYKGDDINNPPVFNAGTKVTGWQKQTDSPIWEAPAADITATRTLYVNDNPATLARSRYLYQPTALYNKTGSSYASDGFKITNTNFPEIKTNPGDVMVCWPILWTLSRTPVNNITRGRVTTVFDMQQPQWATHTTQGYEHLKIGTGRQFYIENALELLDEPGEFYFDKTEKKMYYYPYEEEDMKTAEVYAGTTEKMLQISGSSVSNKVSNIELNNLTFKYSGLNEISEKGVKFNQADHEWYCYNPSAVGYTDRLFPGQIIVNHADSITIKNCDFACLGSNGISMDNGVTNAIVTGNIFRDISGTALVVGHFLHTNTLPSGHQRVENVEVANNVIRRVANEYTGCPAVSIYYAKNVNMHHNDIKDVPYTGISVGWGWGVDATDCRDIRVTNNRIENVTHKTQDGAHIYTLSRMENTHISNNYLIDAGDYRGGIYLDEGTEAITMENNVVTGSDAMIYARSGVNISGCVARNNYTDTTNDACDDSVCSESGTVRVTNGNWPAAAKSIMNEAGVQEMYKHLLSEAEHPTWRILAYERSPEAAFESDEIVDVNRWIIAKEYDRFNEISHSVPSVYPGGEVGDTKPGEWLEFDFYVPTTGTYTLSLRASDGNTASDPACTAKLDLDGNTIQSAYSIPRTGWSLVDYTVGSYKLNAGIHTFRITVQGLDWMIGGFKFDNGKSLPNSSDYNEGMVITQDVLMNRYGK